MKVRNLHSIAVVSLFLLGYGITATAAEIVVPSGGDIRSAVSSAQSGDVIVLESGGVYVVEDNAAQQLYGLDFADIHITIKAEDDATVKPEVTFNGIDIDGVDNSLMLKGIKFISNGGNYFINLVETFMAGSAIKVLDCDVSGFARCAIRGNRGTLSVCDSLIFDNCTFYGFDGGYRFFHFYDLLDFSYFKFTNSTVSGFSEAFIWSWSLSAKYVEIDNCTFNNLVDIKDNFVRIDGDAGVFKVTDCIMTNFASGPVWNIWDAFADTIQHCRYYNIGDLTNTWNLIDDVIEFDPQYADPENLDFTLPTDSPLQTGGTGGGPIGDPRWAIKGTGIEEYANKIVPNQYVLKQNYPNPFNPVTNIEFQLAKSGHVTITVYNARGQLVATLLDQKLGRGNHTIAFNAENYLSGIYFYKIKSGDFTKVKKMLLVK